jgi:hypothetical protein
MKTFTVFYTAANESWLGYNKWTTQAATSEEAEAQFIAERRGHPMRMAYAYMVVEATKIKQLDTRKDQ